MQTIYASHSAIAPFRLLRPTRVEEAAAACADGATCLAGGVDLIPALRAGRRIDQIVWLGGIAALGTVERRGRSLHIGAGVTYARLAADLAITAALPELAQVWRGVANVRVRHAATVGGNIMAGNPQYDMLPALLALDAELVFVAGRGETISLGADSANWPNGILTAIDIPLSSVRRLGFERSYKPVLSLAVCIEARKARIAFGCAYARAVLREVDLDGAVDALADRIVRELPEPLSDWIASGDYRRSLAGVLLKRQFRALVGS